MNAGELPRHVTVNAGNIEFQALVRIDTPKEADYFRHGGILPYVLRQLVGRRTQGVRRRSVSVPIPSAEQAEPERDRGGAAGRGASPARDVRERLVGVGHRQQPGERVQRARHLRRAGRAARTAGTGAG